MLVVAPEEVQKPNEIRVIRQRRFFSQEYLTVNQQAKTLTLPALGLLWCLYYLTLQVVQILKSCMSKNSIYKQRQWA